MLKLDDESAVLGGRFHVRVIVVANPFFLDSALAANIQKDDRLRFAKAANLSSRLIRLSTYLPQK